MKNTAPDKPQAVTCDTIAHHFRASSQPLSEQRHSQKNLFVWVSKGGGRARVDGTIRGFGPSTAIFVPHLTLHAFDFTQGSQGWIVSLDQSLPLPMPEQPILSSVTALSDQNQLAYLFDAIDREYRSGRELGEKALECQAGLLAVWFLRHQQGMSRQILPKDSARRRLMRRFVQLLNERYATQSSVADYAGALDVTTTHLTRVCRQTTGKPASALIHDRLMDEARRALGSSDQKVAQIAAGLGFENPAYFTRLFTQKNGASPSQWRARSRV